VAVCAAINAAVILGLAIYSRTPAAPWGRDRIREETHGWRELAAFAAQLDGPVLADGHQVAAQIMFHEPDVIVAQWPGITRPSELLRRAEWNAGTGRLHGAVDDRDPRLPGRRRADHDRSAQRRSLRAALHIAHDGSSLVPAALRSGGSRGRTGRTGARYVGFGRRRRAGRGWTAPFCQVAVACGGRRKDTTDMQSWPGPGAVVEDDKRFDSVVHSGTERRPR
jgi:hypothetical protein